MNTLDYHVSGERRKRLVRALSEILGEDAVYLGAPSFAYRVDGYTVSRTGVVTCPDTATREEITQLIDALREQGFVLENVAAGSPVFTVELPRAGFTPTALDNLKKIVTSKAELFRACLKNRKRRLFGHKRSLSASKILVNRKIDLRFFPLNGPLLPKNPSFPLFSNKP